MSDETINQSGGRSTLRRKTRPFAIITLIAGFGAGIALSHSCRNSSANEKPIAQLIRELHKNETFRDRIWQAAWDKLPASAKDSLIGLQPLGAPTIRRIAAEQLRDRGVKARAAVPSLTKALRDPDAQVRLAAVQTLASLGSVAEEAVPNLIEFCANTKGSGPRGYLTYLVSQADLALAMIAPMDHRVIALMEKALKEEDFGDPTTPQTRSAAIPAVEKIASTNSIGLAMLTEAFYASQRSGRSWIDPSKPNFGSPDDNHEATIRAKIIGALGRVGAKTPNVLPTLIDGLRDQSSEVRFSSVEALSKVGPSAGKAVPALIAVAKESRVNVRSALRAETNRAPQRFTPGGIDASSPNGGRYGVVELAGPRSISQQVMTTLGAIGPAAVEAVPFLIEQYRDNQNPLRYDAVFAHWRIEGRTDQALPILASGLKDDEAFLRRRVARFLARLGLDALPPFIDVINDEDVEIRLAAIRHCGRCGPAAKHAVPKLAEALKDEKFAVRLAAERALKAIEPDKANEWKADLTPRARSASAY